MIARRRLTATGTVQGVGFRPFVYRLARELGLVGEVRNGGAGAVVEVQGAAELLDRFIQRLRADLPLPGRVEHVQVETLAVDTALHGFAIVTSDGGDGRRMVLAPDGATCARCLAELRDPTDRRHGYAFTNCTLCGPRYTIVHALPYDRPSTTMARFALCPECAREYHDPEDRRFHAQPLACPACGPRVWLAHQGDAPEAPMAGAPMGQDAIGAAQLLLAAGKVVAVKGLGGFHLAVNARDEAAVARLRQRKRRPRKPLAVMVRDLEVAQGLAQLSLDDTALLASSAAPIVLAPARDEVGLGSSLAPNLRDVGLMLPYTPLHHLLLAGPLDALVMTSGNAPQAPITVRNARALRELPADGFLLHDRDIAVACDDSVVRTSHAGHIMVRRARGHVPGALDARHLPARRVLALGAELKVSVATLAEGELSVGRHLGDLDHPDTEEAYAVEVERMLAFAQLTPEVVAVDLHPDLASTQFAAERFAALPGVRVQHHHAHLAAVLVEHAVPVGDEVVGIVLDGLGYGGDGTLWGGEVLRGGYGTVQRVAHLRAVPQPGGDRAALEPKRMAASLLRDQNKAPGEHPFLDTKLAELCALRSVSPLTSSCGRLFDGVAALLGVAPEVQDYEGEAAARLEAAVDTTCDDAYPLPLVADLLDTRALVAALLADAAPVAVRAARFHHGLADGLVAAALATGLGTVVLAGGSLVNRVLRARLCHGLQRAGVRVLLPVRLPPGDGAIAAGQAACAAVQWCAGG